MTEQEKTARAMAALETMATLWAAKSNIRTGVQAMLKLPDAESRILALIVQAHMEGLYEGRMSHRDYPSASIGGESTGVRT